MLFIYWKHTVASTIDGPCTVMFPMIVLAIRLIDPFHQRAQLYVLNFDDQMIMIIHEHVKQNMEGVSCLAFTDEVQECQFIHLIIKNIRLVVSTLNDVINPSC